MINFCMATFFFDLRTISLLLDHINNNNFSAFFFLFLIVYYDSDRSPIDGLSKLAFVISRNGNEDDRLPSAHTCFNHLLLPAYSSIIIMKSKLRYAMTQSEGFGLR